VIAGGDDLLVRSGQAPVQPQDGHQVNLRMAVSSTPDLATLPLRLIFNGSRVNGDIIFRARSHP
jgi:hypothetical protein